MKSYVINKAANLFYKLAQENFKVLQENQGETELETIRPIPEFNNLAERIKPHIDKVRADKDYSRDVPQGQLISIAMVDSVVYTGIGHSDSDWLGAEPALLIRIANFIDEIDFSRKPGYPPKKINLNTDQGCLDYAYELVIKGGGSTERYEFEYYEGPKSRVVGHKNPNTNFSRWVLITLK